MTANRVTRPVRPTFTSMSSSRVRTTSGGAERDRPAGRPRGRTHPTLGGDVVDLDHDPVDLMIEVVAALTETGDVGQQVRLGLNHPGGGRRGQPQPASTS